MKSDIKWRLKALLAQLAEREPNMLEVVGSIPTESILFCFAVALASLFSAVSLQPVAVLCTATDCYLTRVFVLTGSSE